MKFVCRIKLVHYGDYDRRENKHSYLEESVIEESVILETDDYLEMGHSVREHLQKRLDLDDLYLIRNLLEDGLSYELRSLESQFINSTVQVNSVNAEGKVPTYLMLVKKWTIEN